MPGLFGNKFFKKTSLSGMSVIIVFVIIQSKILFYAFFFVNPCKRGQPYNSYRGNHIIHIGATIKGQQYNSYRGNHKGATI
jgi:hypothetical protein